MKPIRLALLWHQHQPDYRTVEGIALPWVRLHATKDYLEMLKHLERYPNMRATINLVPSLIRQIEAYRDGSVDELLFLSQKPTSTLTQKEKDTLLLNCFHSNYERMISRSPRYLELREKQIAKQEFSENDLRDLVVHFALAWTGEFTRSEEPFTSLIAKERDYTDDEKTLLFKSLEILFGEIIPSHKRLFDSGQIDISVTPFYHPILSLLCDTDSAVEATPDVVLPQKRFSMIQDAYEQVRRAKILYQERFDRPLAGMWPAEGSISNKALQVLANEGIRWTASDEGVLLNSLRHESSSKDDRAFDELEKYFPRLFYSGENRITVFFRDHDLSDRIGFDYAHWAPFDAAMNFVQRCKDIRDSIIERYGEDTLEKACISVILDGENCWENFPENGKYFLDEFYKGLTNTPEIKPVTFSDCLLEIGIENIRTISHIVAGSWISSNLKIWIGNVEKNRAWDLLSEAAQTFHSVAPIDSQSEQHVQLAYTSLLKAEGSDWFWWYGDDNSSAQKQIFDSIFRSHLIDMYIHLRMPVPHELFEPIAEISAAMGQTGSMHRAG